MTLSIQVQIEPRYDPQTVADSNVIPMHPGAMKYYRERGYVKLREHMRPVPHWEFSKPDNWLIQRQPLP